MALDRASEIARLQDENEQLRTALESTTEENTRLIEDRDRLLRRLTAQIHEITVGRAAAPPADSSSPSDHSARERVNQTEEELRATFEESQVLTEELEAANTSLHEMNLERDRRVEERTRDIENINAVLRASEASFRAVTELVPDFLWRSDSNGQMRWYSKRWYDYTGHEEQQPLGNGWIDAIHPADRAVSRSSWMASVRQGGSYQREHRIRAGNGEYRWFLVHAEPVSNDRGEPLQWFGAITDIHDQRTGMEALRQSEIRFRTLVEGMPQLVWKAMDAGKWTWASPQWIEYTGLSEEASRMMGWLRAFHPDDREQAKAAWTQAEAGQPLRINGRIWHEKEKRYRHFQTRATAARDDNGHVIEWLGTSTDVDDIVQLQEEQQVLVAELQHRTRNLMAIVQSVMMRTLRGSSDLKDFRTEIDHRLAALARVQGLLSRSEEGQRVTFDALLHEELSAHVALDEGGNAPQVSIRGPRGVSLRSGMVQTFALALHELATNAVKYGALSRPDGHLDVNWELLDGDHPCLKVEWRERGVGDMADASASKSGYGRELIERALPFQLGAKTEYEFGPEGVRCSIELPVANAGNGRE